MLLGPTLAEEPKATVDPNPKSLVIPAVTQETATKLVAQLGNRSYPMRQEALTELRELGRLALPAIEDGITNSTVPEVTLWCEQLLPQAQSQDLKARVECFLADKDGKYKHDLPGANEFFKIAGASDTARTLFKDLWLSNNRDLFIALAISPDEAAKAVAARRVDLNNRALSGIREAADRAMPKSLDVLAVLFVESMIPERLVTAAMNNNPVPGRVVNPCTVISQSTLRADLEDEAKKPVYGALITHWYDTREETRSMYYCLSSANSLKLPPPLKLARKLLTRKDAVPMNKALAICALGRAGNKEDIDLLLPLLKDETVVTAGFVVAGGNGQVRNSIVLQDTALAMVLLLNGDNPKDYGYTERYPTQTATATLRFNYMNFYFDDAEGKAKELRAAALKKWDDRQPADKKPMKK
jgi:hypothetical protein